MWNILKFAKATPKRGIFDVLEIQVSKFGSCEFLELLIMSLGSYLLKIGTLPLNLQKHEIQNNTHLGVLFDNLRVKRQFLVGRTLTFVIGYPNNLHGPNLVI